MDRLIGTTMGPYTITERIGEGGMAIVYKGYQESLHRYVALKVLREELARDQQFLARFRQEALAAANLNHPNILHVYDAGAANGKYFISMAYVDGGTLKDLIHQGLIDPARAVSITIQLAEALDHAHNQGLIHRDVKPSNVLMTRDGRPLLTDFGIAKALFEAQQLTRTGASIGTPEYMAPEQAKGQAPDGRTDIYALGVVLYEMLAARVPFCTDTPVATMYMHVHEPPPPLPVKEAAIPAWLENVVCKALAKDPADRYPTAALFAAALRQGQESWVAAGRAAAGAAAAAATRTPTPPGPAAAIGADEAPTAVEVFSTPPETEAATMAAVGAARTPAPAAATATPIPAKERRKLLVPILIAAIVLLVVTTAATAAVLLSGDGKGTPVPTKVETVVITVEATPTGDMGDAGGEVTPPPGPTEETPATHTVTATFTPTATSTSTPTATPSGTASLTPSPSATASRTPTRTPTATEAATSTPTTAPTEAPTNTPVPPPPTNTPVPPPPTDTPVPPPPTDTPIPPPTPTQPPPPPPP